MGPLGWGGLLLVDATRTKFPRFPLLTSVDSTVKSLKVPTPTVRPTGRVAQILSILNILYRDYPTIESLRAPDPPTCTTMRSTSICLWTLSRSYVLKVNSVCSSPVIRLTEKHPFARTLSLLSAPAQMITSKTMGKE